MGTISEKLTYLNVTKQKLKQAINNIGGEVTDETTFRNYVAELENAYDRLPKTEFEEGESVTLENTLKGKLDFQDGKVGFGQASQVILPSEYQQVEYIESSGSQYINTQYYANQKTKIIADYYIQPNAEGFIFGARVDNGDTNQFGLYYKQDENRYAYRFDNLSVINIYGAVGVKTHTEFSTNKYLINNGTVIQDDIQYTGTFLGTLPLYALAQNQNGTATLVSNIKLYSFKILEDNELIRNMIPCYRISDNVIGMYDTVNNVFYTNAGTGVFGKGANAPTPSQEIPIKSVTGNQDVVVGGKNLANWDLPQNITTSGNKNLSSIPQIEIGEKYYFYGKCSDGTRLGVSNCACVWATSNTQILNVSPNTTFIGKDISNATQFYVYVTNAIAGKTISEFMLIQGEYDSSNLPTYEPYKTPKTYQFSLGDHKFYGIGTYRDYILRTTGKNKYNLGTGTYTKWGITCTYNGSKMKVNGTTSASTNVFDPNTKSIGVFKAGNYVLSSFYTGSVNLNGHAHLMYLRSSNDLTSNDNILTQFSPSVVNSSKAFTLSQDTELFMQWYANSSGIAYDNLEVMIQVEEGSTASDYQPFGVGNWYKVGKIGENALDGNNEVTGGTTGTNAYYLSTSITAINDNDNAVVYSNMFAPCSFTDRVNGKDITYSQNGTINLRTANNTSIDWSTKEKRKAWLNSNSVYVVYILATPTYTPITGTLAEQLEEWWNGQSLDGTTIIEGNGDLPMIIKVRGLKGE